MLPSDRRTTVRYSKSMLIRKKKQREIESDNNQSSVKIKL